jgi:hypothetical protein
VELGGQSDWLHSPILMTCMVVDVILTLIFGDARVKLALLIPLIFKSF